MSLVQIEYRDKLPKERLDILLAQGWFRSSYMMYKSPLLCLNGTVLSIINIRLNIPEYLPKKRHRKLMSKNGDKYHYKFKPVNITLEAEELYQKSKSKFKGFVHDNLLGYLYASAPISPFDTHQIEVYDDEKLVAISYVDIGVGAMASILGLYHPDYAKDSLGIYTMLLELIEAKRLGLQWYYPGYVVDNEPSFNYKLTLGDYLFLDENNEWISLEKLIREKLLAKQLLAKMKKIQAQLIELNQQDNTIYSYPHFISGYIEPFAEQGFLNKPLFIRLSQGVSDFIISFNHEAQAYSLELVVNDLNFEQINESEISTHEKDNKETWNNYIITEEVALFTTLEVLISELV